jgi:hypothetical protein
MGLEKGGARFAAFDLWGAEFNGEYIPDVGGAAHIAIVNGAEPVNYLSIIPSANQFNVKLLSGAGTEMVVADPDGNLIRQPILPPRLGGNAYLISDWDLATNNGWYAGSPGTLNSPADTRWFVGEVVSQNPAIYATQTVHDFTLDSPDDTCTFRREFNNGVWGPWYRLLLSQAELDVRYSQKGSGGFEAGTTTVFYQATAPVGWTQVVDPVCHDRALRIVNTAGGTGGAGMGFSQAFTSRAVPLVDHNHAVYDPGHAHGINDPSHAHVNLRSPNNNQQAQGGHGAGCNSGLEYMGTEAAVTGVWVGASGANLGIYYASQSGQATGSTMDFAVQHLDFILCQKN